MKARSHLKHSQHSLRVHFESDGNNFNAIRLFAACAVVYGHAYAVVQEGGADFVTRYLGYGFTGGLAVDAFFIISGFLVTASVMKGDTVFYTVSRATRILPALWVCVGLLAFVFGPLLATGAYDWSAAWRYFWHLALLYRAEFFIPGVFEGLRDHAINGVLWSIMIEARMYLVLLIMYAVGIVQRKWLFNAAFFALVVASYFSQGGIIWGLSPTDRHVMLLFFIGIFAWVNRDTIAITPFGVAVCLAVLAFAQGSPKFETAYIATFPYLVMACAFSKRWPWPRRMGDYSYGVYLWGWPIQQAILLIDPNMTAAQNQIISIPLAILAGAASWHLLEEPAMRLKGPLARRLRGALWRSRADPVQSGSYPAALK